MAGFTHYWKNDTFHRLSYKEGETLQHIAGKEFVESGVRDGDTIYVVTIKKGILFLLARMAGIKYITFDEAKRKFGYEPWEGEQIISEHSTPKLFNRIVPLAIVKRLRFGNEKPLKFVEPGILDRQTLRGVQKLTQESSDLFDTLIEEPKKESSIANDFPDELPPGSYPEGLKKRVTVNAYERNPKARQACTDHYKAVCQVCTLNFVERYGKIGRDFIHVHHLKTLAKIQQEYRVDPVKDLRPVCPNCHAMLHKKEPPLKIDELKAMLRK